MGRRFLAMVIAAALIGGCSGGIDRTVERPVGDVEAILLSGSTDKLYIADQLPGSGHSVESTEGGVVWHFTLNDQDYARMTFALAPAGPHSTRVTAAFEEVDDAKGEGVAYLREMAEAVAEESAAAALDGRAVDMAALQNRMRMVATDPYAVASAQRAIYQEVINVGEANRSPQSFEPPAAYDAPKAYDRPQKYDSTD